MGLGSRFEKMSVEGSTFVYFLLRFCGQFGVDTIDKFF